MDLSGKFSRKLLCLAAACACASAAYAGPAGPVVSAGRASYDPATLTLSSTTAHTQIGWQSFHVGAGEVVNFIQPSAQSTVLNKIFNPQSLNILGSLRSNGSVLFMNSGRVSGAGLNLDLAGMISSSLRLPQMALAQSGSTLPAHPLTSLAEGSVYVISQDEQAVTTVKGEVLLNPGRTAELAHATMPTLRVVLTAPYAESINLSRLVGGKRENGIFAGLFRIPAAVRQAAQPEAATILSAWSGERGPDTAELERFYRYALLYAQSASASGIRRALAPLASEVMANLDAQPISVALDAVSIPDRTTLLALPSAEPPAEMVAMRSPQSTTLAFASAEPPAEMTAERSPQPLALAFVAVETPAEVATRSLPPNTLAYAPAEPPAVAVAAPASRAIRGADGSDAEAASPRNRQTPRSSPAIIVVALAQHSVASAPHEDAPAKEVRIERRAPRYFTDFRGAMFFM